MFASDVMPTPIVIRSLPTPVLKNATVIPRGVQL
jgi:hypothetical protein